MTIDFDAVMADANAEKQIADRRRVALVAAGCTTYVMKAIGRRLVVLCLCCGMSSINPYDIAQCSCNFCQVFHRDGAPV